MISQPLKDERIIMPKSRQMIEDEYEADFKKRMEEFRARSNKPKPKTEFTVEDDDLLGLSARTSERQSQAGGSRP